MCIIYIGVFKLTEDTLNINIEAAMKHTSTELKITAKLPQGAGETLADRRKQGSNRHLIYITGTSLLNINLWRMTM